MSALNIVNNHLKCILLYGPGHAKTCLMPYANNKGADQPAHPRSLISTFVVLCLDTMYTCYIQSFKILASFCSLAGWFDLTWSKIPEDTFSRDVAHIYMGYERLTRCPESPWPTKHM